ncbi:MAG: NAD(+) diphosphatase [Pararhodobacter sp.]|nr:NAD(+) diphosphatase [Pararhodobacter sp.]
MSSESSTPDTESEAPSFACGWDDRGAALRADPATLASPDALVLPIWRGRPLIAGEDKANLAAGWVAADSPVLAHAGSQRLFLGLHAGHPRLAADISAWEPAAPGRSADAAAFQDAQEYRHPALPVDHRFADLRGAMAGLNPADAAMAATARALFNWHRTHGFCAACGAKSTPALAGWERHCPACGARHFPRTDPVVIMLVVRAGRVLLGRSPGWPSGMYSALAGFVEPGETLENAVRREVHEETGVRVGAVRFIASQPWPWPNSLMMGFLAEAEPGDEAITLDHELEDARWFTRDEMLTVMAGSHPTLRHPRRGAIAHHMLHAWLAGNVE